MAQNPRYLSEKVFMVWVFVTVFMTGRFPARPIWYCIVTRQSFLYMAAFGIATVVTFSSGQRVERTSGEKNYLVILRGTSRFLRGFKRTTGEP
jgi:hypothetical protein